MELDWYPASGESAGAVGAATTVSVAPETEEAKPEFVNVASTGVTAGIGGGEVALVVVVSSSDELISTSRCKSPSNSPCKERSLEAAEGNASSAASSAMAMLPAKLVFINESSSLIPQQQPAAPFKLAIAATTRALVGAKEAAAHWG